MNFLWLFTIVYLLQCPLLANENKDRIAVEKDEKIITPRDRDSFDRGFFKNGSGLSGNTFEQIKNLMDRMFSDTFFERNFFQDQDNNGSGGFLPFGHLRGLGNSEVELKINEFEDDKYKIISFESPGLDKDGININIEKGMIQLSGKVKKTHTDGQTQSISIRSFAQSLPVPQGVDESKVEFENSTDKVILKFPKS